MDNLSSWLRRFQRQRIIRFVKSPRRLGAGDGGVDESDQKMGDAGKVVQPGTGEWAPGVVEQSRNMAAQTDWWQRIVGELWLRTHKCTVTRDHLRVGGGTEATVYCATGPQRKPRLATHKYRLLAGAGTLANG